MLHVDIGDRELDTVNAALEAWPFEGALERAVDLRGVITNLKEGRERISASEVEVGDLLGYGVVVAIEEHPGGVTFTIGGGHFSHSLDHQLRVERDGKVL